MPLGAVNLLVAVAVLLEIAVLCVSGSSGRRPRRPARKAEPGRVGGNAFPLPEVIRSPHLLGVGILGQPALVWRRHIVYFEQANIVAAVIHDRNAQTRLFASIDRLKGTVLGASRLTISLS